MKLLTLAIFITCSLALDAQIFCANKLAEKYPLLSSQEQLQLIKQWRERPDYRDALIRSQMRLVIFLAKKYQGRGLELDDLIQEGSIGVINSLESFDAQKGIPFSTYAGEGIRIALRKSLTLQSRTIRFPAYIIEGLTAWNKTKTKLENELLRTPKEEEIRNQCGLKKEWIPLVIHASNLIANNRPIEKADKEYKDIGLTKAEESELQEKLRILINNLNEREQIIIIKRFGLDGSSPLSLKEIGEQLGVTRQAINYLENKILEKMFKQL